MQLAENLIAAEPPPEQLSLSELVELCAVDSELFCRTFFPKTVRQPSAVMHGKIWQLAESENRRVNIQVFRGGAKTSTLRMYTAKRIAYGIAHTVLYIGKSEGHAIRSINWLRKQVQYNTPFATAFNLRPGEKWQDIEAEIWHGVDEYPIWLMGMGITGSIRGINRDDFRPDLIVCDDILDEENSATPEQRKKISELLYGAVLESLTPATEAPDAKLVMLQTPQHKEDASTLALSDPSWASAVFGCWAPGTEEEPIDRQVSAWPERYTSESLREEKKAHLRRHTTSVWMREKECRLVSPETSAFKAEWLRYYDIEPDGLMTIMGIDPVPPPSDTQIAKGLQGKDYEALAVVGRRGNDFYLLEYSLNRGHNPDWTLAEFFRLAFRWRPLRVLIESVAYQRTLAWLIRQAMEHQRKWYPIEAFDDKRAKYQVITDGLNGISSAGHLHIRESHSDFISQFRDYPDVAHDDLIEIVARCVTSLSGTGYDGDDEETYAAMMAEEDDLPQLELVRGCP